MLDMSAGRWRADQLTGPGVNFDDGRCGGDARMNGEQRGSRRPDVGSSMASLTTRQREVLERVARGKTNRQIADELGIAPATVKRHIEDILIALEAADRHDAANRYWREMGQSGS
jgi:DNA-binding NarL/FixJ family response regulator